MDQLIRAVTVAETPSQLVTAVKNLAAATDPSAIPSLIAVFGYNNPEAAMVAAAALKQWGETAVPQLLNQIDDYNYGARAYSIRTLAAIADPRALDILISTTIADFAPSVRRAAARGLGKIHWHKLDPTEAPIAINRALETLILICQDTDWSIRYAAVVGLQALAQEDLVRLPILAQLQLMLTKDTEKAVRARAQLALNQ
ncbi:MAG: HEAT repeat domain-containing protein [Cuspidothrix sp.]